MVRGEAMRKAGLVYLERESVEINLRNGMRWRVYGSPVCLLHSLRVA